MVRARVSPRRGFAMVGATIKGGQRAVNFAVSCFEMKKLAPRRVADLVARALPQMAERLHEIRLRTRWASIAGPDVARRTQPGRLEAGCLTITVDNSPWLHELTLRQGELASRLGEHVLEIRSLRFVMGTVARDAP